MVVALADALLVPAGVFEPIPLAVFLAATTVACYVVGLRRSGVRSHVTAAAGELSSGGLFVWLGLGAEVVVAVVWAGVPILPFHGPCPSRSR